MSAASSDRNLLFGVLALQMDFLDRDALIAAMQAWIHDKTKPLGDILVEQHALRPDERDALDTLVQKHLDRHCGDVEKSLAAVKVPTPLREELRSLADPALRQCRFLGTGRHNRRRSISNPFSREPQASAVELAYGSRLNFTGSRTS